MEKIWAEGIFCRHLPFLGVPRDISDTRGKPAEERLSLWTKDITSLSHETSVEFSEFSSETPYNT